MKRSKVLALLVIIVIASIGTYLLVASHAASPYASKEAESGTVTVPAITKTGDSKASGNSYVQFGTSPSNSTCGSTAATPTAPVTGYSLIACEDFNGTSSTHFKPYTGGLNGAGGTVVGKGRLAEQCTYDGTELVETQLANGATCGGTTDFKGLHGLWEVRMRAYSTGTSGSAPHPVLILWPDDSNDADGELDFFETNMGSPAGGFFHCINDHPKNCYVIPKTPSIDYSQYHIYSILWTANDIKGYVDGNLWYDAPAPTSGETFIPTVSSHLTIQLDNLSHTTPVDPGVMDVDWVHQYN